MNNTLWVEKYRPETIDDCVLPVLTKNVFLSIVDNDEIPNLQNLEFENVKNNLIYFNQKLFYYKFNLLYENLTWHGSRACKKKFFKSPQWLRNAKYKKYPLWRLDIILSNKKYNNI